MLEKLIALNQVTMDIQATALYSLDGLLITSTIQESNTEEVGAIAAALQALSDRTVELLRRGNLMQVQIQGDRGNMVVSRVGENVLLVVLTRENANMGLVLHEIRRFKKQQEQE